MKSGDILIRIKKRVSSEIEIGQIVTFDYFITKMFFQSKEHFEVFLIENFQLVEGLLLQEIQRMKNESRR